MAKPVSNTEASVVSLRTALLAGLSASPFLGVDSGQPTILQNVRAHPDGLSLLRPWERPAEFDTILQGMVQNWPYPNVLPGACSLLFADVNGQGMVYPLTNIAQHWAAQDPYDIENLHYEVAVQQMAVVTVDAGVWSFPGGLPTTYGTQAEAEAAAILWIEGQHRLDFHVRWLWQRADFGTFWMAVNGRDTLYYNPATETLQSSLVRRGIVEPHLQINTACAFLGQLLLGGLVPYDNWLRFWNMLWDRYREAKDLAEDAVPVFTKETVVWSAPGGGDVKAILAPEWFLGENQIYNGDFRIYVELLANPSMVESAGTCPNWTAAGGSNWTYNTTLDQWGHAVGATGTLDADEGSGAASGGCYSVEFDAVVTADSCDVGVVGDTADPYALTTSGRHYAPCTYLTGGLALRADADTAFAGTLLRGSVRSVAGWYFQQPAWTYEHDPVRGTTAFRTQDYGTGIQTYDELDTGAQRVLHWDDQGTGATLYATQTNPYIEAHQTYRVVYEIKIISGEFWVEMGGVRGAIRSALSTPGWITYVEYLVHDGQSAYVSLVGKGEGYIRSITMTPGRCAEVLDSFTSCAAGWLHLVGCGEVLNLRPLSRSIVAYCTRGVWLLVPTMDPIPGFGSRQLSVVGLGYRDAVSGDALHHAYIDSAGNLCVIEEQTVLRDGPPVVLGYSRHLKPLLERGPVVMSHDPVLDEFRMGNLQDADALGYIWTPKFGLSSHLQAFGPATYWDGEMLCLNEPTEAMKDVRIRFEDLAFGTSSVKTLSRIEIIGVDLTDVTVQVEYRHVCSGGYTMMLPVRLTDRLVADLNISGAQFNIEIVGKGSTANARIGDIRVHWTVRE